MPLFAVVAERLNPFEAHETDSIHRLMPSGSRTPFSCSRCTSGKSLFTSMRAAWPALMARDSPLSTGPFCCGVCSAVSSRRIWRLLQYSTNAELVYSVPLSVRNARGTPMLVTNRCTTPRMADALLSRVPYGRWKREALSTNTTTYREPPKDSGNGPAVSMWTRPSGAASRDVVRCGVGADALGHRTPRAWFQLPYKLNTVLLGGGFQYTRMGVGKGNVEVVNIYLIVDWVIDFSVQ